MTTVSEILKFCIDPRTFSQIMKAFNYSAGATGNSLVRLQEKGRIIKISDDRYKTTEDGIKHYQKTDDRERFVLEKRIEKAAKRLLQHMVKGNGETTIVQISVSPRRISEIQSILTDIYIRTALLEYLEKYYSEHFDPERENEVFSINSISRKIWSNFTINVPTKSFFNSLDKRYIPILSKICDYNLKSEHVHNALLLASIPVIREIKIEKQMRNV